MITQSDITSGLLNSTEITTQLFPITTQEAVTDYGTDYSSTIYEFTSNNSSRSNVSTSQHFDINVIKFIYKRFCCKTVSNSSLNMCNEFAKIFDLPEKCEISKPLQSTIVTLYVLIIAVSVIGNSLVLLTFIFNKNMRSTTNIFIVSLAGSDMLLIVTTVPFNIGMVLSPHWTLGPFACKLVPFMTTFSVGCSSLTLCCIALDRFYAIVFPLKLQFFQTRYKMTTILSTVWIVSVLSAIPQATSYELIEFHSVCATITECLFPQNETLLQQFLRLWMSFSILFIFPIMVMVILYGIIIHKLWGKTKFCIATNVNSSDGLRLRQKRRAIKMLITVITLFVVCWLPLQLYNIMTIKLHVTNSVSIHLRVCLQCLAMSSGCYNPIVYAFMNEKFRKSFALFLLCKNRHPRVYPLTIRKQENTSRKVTQLRSEDQRMNRSVETQM